MDVAGEGVCVVVRVQRIRKGTGGPVPFENHAKVLWVLFSVHVE